MNINVLSENQLAQLSQLISSAQSILVVGHVSPDGDAIGSCLGWAEYLRCKGKDPVVVVPDQYPDFLTWLPNNEKIVRYDRRKETVELMMKTADLIFCLDFNTSSRVRDMEQVLVSSPAKKVMIDHHPSPDVDTVLCISHPEMSSTSELVFRIVWQAGAFEAMGKHFAVPIYCGMMTDTGGFTFNSSQPEIYFIISQLLTKHIDKDKIYRNVYNNYSTDRMRLMGYVMYEKLVVDEKRHAAYFTLTRDDMRRFHYIKGDAEGLVNIPQQIKGLKLSISLREDTEKENLIWVSLRSVDNFSCTAMAQRFFNGGGHLNASGGRLNCSMDEAVEVVRKAIDFYEDELK